MESNSNRILHTNSREFNSQFKFSSNYQSTKKYNLISFLPFSLILQFKRAANLYFLAIAVLQSISIVSALNPLSAIVPLVFVLSVSMVREGIEDYFRFKSDKEANSSPILVYQNSSFVKLTFKDIQVGDVLLVNKDEPFPADLILLSSCNENGTAYIETSTLDGEKNLKPRQSVLPTKNLGITSDLNFEYEILCENPNPKIYNFSGSIEINGQKFSLDKNQLLIGGAFLRNTQNVIGVVIYTGNDTKLRQNLMAKTSKQSKIEKRVNNYIVLIILLQLTLCLIAGIGSGHFLTTEAPNYKYIKGIDYSPSIEGVLSYLTYFLLLNTMLPISLIISLELIKVAQGFMMQRDKEMYSKVRDKFCKVSSYNITEELGMIQHIFSDKTGTLTSNRMEFKFCSIGNKVYGDQKFLSDLNYVTESSYSTREIIFTFNPRYIINDLFSTSKDPERLIYDFKYTDLQLNFQNQLVMLFVKCMALCHECLIDYEKGEIKYIGQSPDEITLVDAARHIGIEYHKIFNNVITLMVRPFGVKNIEEKYEKICFFEFDSDRKRNSIIVKEISTGEFFLFIKGADNVIRDRLDKCNSKEYLSKINSDLMDFSKRGLRTLLLAFKRLDPNFFYQWKKRFDLASTLIENRSEKINALAEEIEKNLFLLGCTAVEDALQAEVPSTISDILKSGIKLWMLTGDKLETAINIGKTCSLISENTKVLTCSESKLENCFLRLKSLSEKSGKRSNLALVIEGHSLEIVLYDEKNKEKVQKYPEYSENIETRKKAALCRKYFLKIAEKCATLICCRVTPGQKREVVKLMKEETKCISLAIGDGANDVSMIMEADVGIGIYGEEGMQAIQACDYGIGEFRFLWELLFVHGRFNYLRVSEMILYFFYKNIVFTIPQFFFAFYCGFSGRSVYDDWYITLYNTIFTALPLMARGLFEKDVMIPNRNQISENEEALIRNLVPMVYSLGKNNEIFTSQNFLGWFINGILHACLVFFLPLYAVESGIIDKDGHSSDFWFFSITSFTSVIFLVNLKLAFYIRVWNKVHIICIFVMSIGIYIVFILGYDAYAPTTSRGSILQIIISPGFYIVIICVLLVSFIADGGIFILKRSLWPSKSEVLMDFSVNYQSKKRNTIMKLNNSRRKKPELLIND